MNIKEVGGYKGPANFGIRELDFNEQNFYCQNISSTNETGLFLNSSNSTSPPYIPDNFTLSFRDDFEIRLFLSGCYFIDLVTGDWVSDGMEIMRDSNALIAHCQTTHLTDFAGGFKSVVPSINFAAAFANASFLDNPVIYSTIMGLSILYILLAVIARIMDYLDKKKNNIKPLPDNSPQDCYFYEIAVLTGTRMNSGTNSKVNLRLELLKI